MIKLKATTPQGKFDEYGGYVLKGGYLFDEENKEAVRACIEVFEKNETGLMLYGNPGSGKTLLFDMMQRIIHPESPRQFVKVNVLEVVLDFNNKHVGHSVFKKWSNKNVFFDDLGTEDKGYLFGEKVEVFEKFIQFRYDLFRSKRLKTHFTTNLGKTALNDRYGMRCLSRLNEMCVRVDLGAKAEYTDRRQLRNFLHLPAVYHETKESKELSEIKERYEFMKEEAKNAPPVESGGMGQRFKRQMGF